MAGEKPSTSYGSTPISVVHPNGSWLGANGPIGATYDNAEFTLATGQTDYDVSAGQSSSFNNITTASYIEIRTDQTIIVKFNETTNDSYTITSSDSPAKFNVFATNIYITTASGSTAAIKIWLQ